MPLPTEFRITYLLGIICRDESLPKVVSLLMLRNRSDREWSRRAPLAPSKTRWTCMYQLFITDYNGIVQIRQHKKGGVTFKLTKNVSVINRISTKFWFYGWGNTQMRDKVPRSSSILSKFSWHLTFIPFFLSVQSNCLHLCLIWELKFTVVRLKIFWWCCFGSFFTGWVYFLLLFTSFQMEFNWGINISPDPYTSRRLANF